MKSRSGPGGTVERLHVGDELDQVPGGEARGEAQMAQDLHQQPPGVAAGPLRALQRLVGRLHAGLHPDEIADLALQLLVEPHQHVDRLLAGPDRRPEAVEPRGEQRADRCRLEKRNQLLRQRRRVGERR